MHIEGKYLLLSYRDIPDTDFICEIGGDLRIRVLKIPRTKLTSLPAGTLLGAGDKLILVFENISNKAVDEQEELVRAVEWYATQLGIESMKMIYFKNDLF